MKELSKELESFKEKMARKAIRYRLAPLKKYITKGAIADLEKFTYDISVKDTLDFNHGNPVSYAMAVHDIIDDTLSELHKGDDTDTIERSREQNSHNVTDVVESFYDLLDAVREQLQKKGERYA